MVARLRPPLILYFESINNSAAFAVVKRSDETRFEERILAELEASGSR
jgi:hypothetical protein